MLEVRNLRKVYKTKKGADVNALDGITLQFPETGMVFLLGKSGSGKSTLLNVISGMDSYEEGELLIEGQPTSHYLQPEWEEYREKYISFIFQDYKII